MLGILLRFLIGRNKVFMVFYAENYWRKSRKKQLERQRGKERLKQSSCWEWSGRKIIISGKSLQPFRSRAAFMEEQQWHCLPTPSSLYNKLTVVVGDGDHWYSFPSRKHRRTAKPDFTFKELESHCSCLILLVITIVSSRMIATASLFKHLQKIKIAKDLCGTESLNSGKSMFKGSNHHVTLPFVYVVNLTSSL